MDELQAIWNKLNDLQTEVGALIKVDKVDTIYEKLKKEEEQQKKWMPFMVPYIICLMLGMTWLVRYTGGKPLDLIQISGLILITLGGLSMIYLMHLARIPVDLYEHNHTSVEFMKNIKGKLLKRRHLWAIAMIVYILSLTIGLHLLIFGIGSLAGKGGSVGAFYGIMFGLMGASAGGMYSMHQARYGGMLQRIDRFLKL